MNALLAREAKLFMATLAIFLRNAVVCGAQDYAELAAPFDGSRRLRVVAALHNYAGRLTSLNIAISLSGTWNLPRLSVGGTPMASVSSFSVGSVRR